MLRTVTSQRVINADLRDTHDSRRLDLDGLRGLAISFVVFSHTDIYPMALGMTGVAMFFVLSGFIITRLLLREERIDLRSFYLRRALRLFPALWLMLAFVAVVGLAGGWASGWLAGIAGALTYSSNWLLMSGADLGPVFHAWSLAIEEQFYLVWPLALVIVPRRFLLPLALAGAFAGTTLHNVWKGPNDAAYFSSFTNAGALLAGCAVALSGRRLPRLAGSLGIALIFVGGILTSQLAAVLGASLVVASEAPALTPLAWIGRRAYGLYLWNWPLDILFPAAGIPVVIATFVCAEFSWRFVEQPLSRRFHARLRPRGIERRTPQPVAVPG